MSQIAKVRSTGAIKDTDGRKTGGKKPAKRAIPVNEGATACTAHSWRVGEKKGTSQRQIRRLKAIVKK